ncbi:hypothetical protein TrVE_jg14307 [Triparma verrucosa]|uniref:Threonylcarbamoyl-AMP synthase n=1 Tax=Triparma verrucosa TaxID=1606542 RepID=A0A9W7C6H1_9STRA|nr:hypothetical protein TrVE_jg14307 [Triparma verrucosa]
MLHVRNGRKCIRRLEEGGIVALPTETVYGLASTLTPSAKKIFTLKSRPLTSPLIVHVSSLSQSLPYINCPPPVLSTFTSLTTKFWPGPLTVILPSSPLVPSYINAGTKTVALRCPNNDLTLEILKERPLCMPSANKYGHISPTSSEHVMSEFEEDDVWVLEGGEGEVGIESTVVKVGEGGIELLRPGRITATEIRECLSSSSSPSLPVTSYVPQILSPTSSSNGSPGQNLKHYSPNLPCYIIKDVSSVSSDSVYITREDAGGKWNIVVGKERVEWERKLYGALREAENIQGAKRIFIEEVPHSEEYDGVRDRVFRAAEGKYYP